MGVREPDVVMHVPPGQTGEPVEVAVLHSGFGDGLFPIDRGLDADGEPHRLAITFNVMETMIAPDGDDDEEGADPTVERAGAKLMQALDHAAPTD